MPLAGPLLTLRAFIAAPLPPEVAAALRRLLEELQASFPAPAVRWSRPEQIHLTLKFLGDIPSASVDELTAGLQRACRGIAPFQLVAENLGCFPEVRNPRVLWVGVSGELQVLAGLQSRIATETAAFTPTEKAEIFHPHLTLGRVKNLHPPERRRLTERLQARSIGRLGEWQVDCVRLLRSTLSPAGSVYSELAVIPLAAT